MVLEVKSSLEVAVLVEDGLGAGAVLVPLMPPKLQAVVARARQGRPIRPHLPYQVTYLQIIH